MKIKKYLFLVQVEEFKQNILKAKQVGAPVALVLSTTSAIWWNNE